MIINLINNTKSFYITTVYDDINYKKLIRKVREGYAPKLTIDDMPKYNGVNFFGEIYPNGKIEDKPCIKCRYYNECSHILINHDDCFEKMP